MSTPNNEKQIQRRRQLLGSVEQRLDHPANGRDLAGDVYLSRFHFQRVFRRAVGEPPSTLRRRLVLERAAYELRTTAEPITRLALQAGYTSPEGFSRAFRSAYGMSPRSYRLAARRIKLLPGPSGVHFLPGSTGFTITSPEGGPNMDLMDRIIERDYVSKRRILECARLLSDRQLDAPLAFRLNLLRWVEPARTLRESLANLSGSGWVDLMFERLGWIPEDDSYRKVEGSTAAAMIERFESYHRAYCCFLKLVSARNIWDQEWVDDTCEQPETFAIGRVLEETLSGDIAYSRMLERMMEQMGFQLDEMPDSIG